MSPEVLDLLRSEMRAIAVGVERIAGALVVADWGTVEDASRQMHASYLMNRELSAAQAAELATALPAGFKALDAALHDRAARLAEAAAARDAELAVFHYSRLLENCTRCHAAYARARFPGFDAPSAHGH